MTQKALKAGTSEGGTIPEGSLKELDLKVGESVRIKPVMQEGSTELLEWTDRFIERYRGALDSLAKK